MPRKKIIEPIFIVLIRIITAIVFIFSSIVKGVDPLGTNYRVIDYLEAYGWYSLVDYSFFLSILLISTEFLLGVALLLKLKSKLASLGVLLIMVFFTVVTYFDAMYELVPDCGCFGDAIKLTNWETFYKNIVLLGFALIIFLNRRKLNVLLVQWAQLVLLLIILSIFDLFIYYNYAHLPMIDFREWKVGNDMKSSGKKTVVNYLVYKNKNTGEIEEYVSPDYPWNDSIWMSEWEFITQRIDDSKLVLKHGLQIEDEDGTNMTDEIIENPDYQLILTVYDMQVVEKESMNKASELFDNLSIDNISFVMVTSSAPEEINSLADEFNINYDVYYGDDIELKAMMRSNPGMIFLKDGIVVDKWHHNDFPTIEEILELTSK